MISKFQLTISDTAEADAVETTFNMRQEPVLVATCGVMRMMLAA